MDDEGTKNQELVAKMEEDFNKLGITLMGTDGQMKSTFDILSELSKVYPTLDQNTKNYYSALIGGKTQVDVVNSILGNFTTAIKANESAMNSSGSAMKENEKYMDSIEGKLKQLESAWQEFAINTLESDTVKGFIDAAKAALKFIETIGGLPTILSAVGTALLVMSAPKIISNFISIGNSISKLSGNLTSLISLSKETGESIFSVGKQVLSSTEKLSLGIGVIQGITAAIGIAITAWNAYASAVDNAYETSKKEVEKTLEEKKAKDDIINSFIETTKGVKDESTYKVILAQKQKELNEAYGEEKLKLDDSMTSRALAITQMQQASQEDLKLAAAKLKATKNEKDFKDSVQDTATSLGKQAAEIVLLLPLLGGYTAFLPQIENAFKAMTYGEQGLKDLQKVDSIKNVTKKRNELAKLLETYREIQNPTEQQKTTLTELNKKYDEAANKVEDLEKNVKLYQQMQANGIILTKEEQKEYDDYITAQKEYDATLAVMTERIANQYNLTESQRKALNDFSSSQLNGISTSEQYGAVMDNLGNSLDIVTKAFQEQKTQGRLSQKTVDKLLGSNSDYVEFLKEENGVITLNGDAFKVLTQAKYAEMQATMEAQATNLEAKLDSERSAADAATTAYKKLANAKLSAMMVEKSAMMVEKASASLGERSATNLQGKMNIGKTIEGKAKAKAEAAQKAVSDTQAEYDALQGRISSLKNTINSLNSQDFSTITPKGSSGGAKGSGSGKGKSKSAQEEYKAEIDTLYNYKNALDNAKESVDKLSDALGDTDNFNEQERYLNQLIDATNNQINKTNELKNAQTNQINDYINQLRAQGFAIDYNNQTNELYINNMQHLADFSGDTAKNLEKLIDKIQDLNDDNRSLDGSVRDLTGDVKDYYKQLEDIPEKKLKKFNELMKDFQQNRLDQIQNQIDDIQHEMDNDERIKAIEKQIEALENQNDELDKQKELEEKLLAVEEAKIKLANAQKNRNVQIYRENEGWVEE